MKSVITGLLALWLVVAFLLGALGAFERPPGTPPIPILIGVAAPLVVFLVAYWGSARFRAFVLAIDLPLATAIQAWRAGGSDFSLCMRTEYEIFSREPPNVPGKALTAVQVDYAPGETSKPHHHSGVVLAYVVSGEIRSQVGNAPPRVYHAGETFFEDLGAHHLISENASTSAPARLLAVFVAEGSRIDH